MQGKLIAVSPCKIINKLYISKVKWYGVNISIPKRKIRRNVRRVYIKARLKHSLENIGSCSFRLHTSGMCWHESSFSWAYWLLVDHLTPLLGWLHLLRVALLGRCSVLPTCQRSQGLHYSLVDILSNSCLEDIVTEFQLHVIISVEISSVDSK